MWRNMAAWRKQSEAAAAGGAWQYVAAMTVCENKRRGDSVSGE